MIVFPGLLRSYIEKKIKKKTRCFFSLLILPAFLAYYRRTRVAGNSLFQDEGEQMNRVSERFSAIFNLRPGEAGPTILMFLHSFCLGVSTIFLSTASYALFLSRFSINVIPYAYILSALITTGFGVVYSKMEGKLSFSRQLLFTLGCLFAVLIFFYIQLKWYESDWIALALVVWYNVLTVLAGLEFWSLAGRMFNVRQGKRLYGLIGAGAVVAAITGGLLVHFIVLHVGTRNLILISATGIGLALAVLLRITRVYGKKLENRYPEGEKPEEKKTAELFKDRYIATVFGVAGFSMFGYYLMDFIFYNQVKSALPDETAIAGFLGIYFAVFRIFNLISNTFVLGRLMSRYGLSAGLVMVPATVGTGLVTGLLAHLVFQIPMWFFWIISVTKLFEEVFRVSIEEPSIRILYQPIPPGWRLKSQTILETMVEPLSGALAGVFLILLTTVLSFSAHKVAMVLLVLLFFWGRHAVKLRKEYSDALTKAIAKRRIEGRSISLEDGSSKAVLQKGLKSRLPGEVIYCINMLEEIEHENLPVYLIELLDHPEQSVRSHVLAKIASGGQITDTAPIVQLLERETVKEVQCEALQALCAVGENEVFDRVFAYLDEKELLLRKGALVGLLKNGGIDGVLSAGTHLNALLDSRKAEERKLAAEVLGRVGMSGFYRPLIRLLNDEDPDVRKEAVIASGSLKNPRLFPYLLSCFASPRLKSSAVSAVVSFGETILDELEEAFDQEHQSREVRKSIIRSLEKIGGKKAVSVLSRKIDFPEEDIRNHVLRALVQCGYQASGKDFPFIRTRIMNEVNDAAWALCALIDIGEDKVVQELRDALLWEIDKNRKRIFLLLAMVYPKEAIADAQRNLNGDSLEKRAYALEALDTILSAELKDAVFPLLENIGTSQRLSRLIHLFPQETRNRHDRLKEIMARSHKWTSSWTKITALFIAGKVATREFYDAVVSCLSDPDPVIRETAIWALGCINPDDLTERITPITRDPCSRVADYARFVINSVGFATIPMGRGYLTRSGKYTAELFANILLDEGERRARRSRAAGILSRFKGESAKKALVDGLAITDKSVRTEVLSALVKGKYALDTKSVQKIRVLFRHEINDAGTILKSLVTFLPEEKAARLVDALGQELVRSRKRILHILTLLNENELRKQISLTPVKPEAKDKSRKKGNDSYLLADEEKNNLPDAENRPFASREDHGKDVEKLKYWFIIAKPDCAKFSKKKAKAALPATGYATAGIEAKYFPETAVKTLDRFLLVIRDKDLRRKARTLFVYQDMDWISRNLDRLYAKVARSVIAEKKEEEGIGGDNISGEQKDKDLHGNDAMKEKLREIAFGSTVFTLSWSRICAIELIVHLGLVEMSGMIAESLYSQDEIIRSSSAWALYHLDRELYEKYRMKLQADRHPLVIKTIRQLEEGG